MRDKKDPVLIDFSQYHKRLVSFVGSNLLRNQAYLGQKSENTEAVCLVLLQDVYDNLLELGILTLDEMNELSLRRLGNVMDPRRKIMASVSGPEG